MLKASSYSNAHCKVEECRVQLQNIQNNASVNSDTQMEQEAKSLSDRLRHWSKVEESILCQKATIN